MDKPPSTRFQYASFLVRMWHPVLAEAPDRPGPWQGEIEHIQSGRRRVFRSPEELLALLLEQAGEAQGTPDVDRNHCLHGSR
jgi:hypothetical protein